jgi:hypothetical protein
MRREEVASRAHEAMLPLSIDDDLGEAATAKLYGDLLADVFPGREDFGECDLIAFVRALQQFRLLPLREATGVVWEG